MLVTTIYARISFMLLKQLDFFWANWHNSILLGNSFIQPSIYLVVPSGHLSVQSWLFDAILLLNLNRLIAVSIKLLNSIISKHYDILFALKIHWCRFENLSVSSTSHRILRRFYIKALYTFWDMCKWNMWKLCLQTFRNRIC